VLCHIPQQHIATATTKPYFLYHNKMTIDSGAANCTTYCTATLQSLANGTCSAPWLLVAASRSSSRLRGKQHSLAQQLRQAILDTYTHASVL